MAILLDGSLGITTPGLTNTGTETLVNLTTTGNTTLGDATTDTLTVGVTGIVKDASGNVGIGTATPLGKLHISSATPALLTGGYSQLNIFSTDAIGADKGGRISFGGVSGASGFDPYGFCAIAGLKDNATSSNFSGYLTFSTATSGGTVTERMRIDSSGNVGIGVSSSLSSKLTVAADQASYTNDVAQITAVGGTNPAQRIYLGVNTSTNKGFIQTTLVGTAYQDLVINPGGGNLLVGTTTSAYGKLEVDVNLSTSGGAARFINNATTGYTGELVQMITAQGAATTYNILSCYYSGGAAYAFKVRGDGTIYAQNTTVQSASDERFKENIVNSSEGLNVITALRPVRFDLKEGNGVTAKQNQLGFIAQEVKSVFPDAVDVWGESDDPENPYLSLGSTALIPVLVKAIQEQQALIQSLTDRITALEKK